MELNIAMTIGYTRIFSNLIHLNESEVVEFKRAENSFDFDDLGKYFSALKVFSLSYLCNGTTD